MNKSKTTTIDIDWDEIETLIKAPELPRGAVTAKIMCDKLGCSYSGAKRRMNKLVEAGWVKHKFNNGRTSVSYVIKGKK